MMASRRVVQTLDRIQ